MGNLRRIVGFVALCVGVLAPAAAASALPQYVDLGDSYSSGVGTRVFYEESGECNRSPDAYGPKIAAAKGYTLNFEACSGAKTPEVNEKQLGKLSSTTTLVTITIGGNDAGFSNVIINCALYYFTCGGAISEANEFIDNKLPGAAGNDLQRHPRQSDHGEGRRARLPEAVHRRRQDVQRQLPHLGQREENERIGGTTRRVIKARAEAAKFTFVNPTSAFEPHEVCSSSEWLNGQSNPLSRKLPPERLRAGRVHHAGRGSHLAGVWAPALHRGTGGRLRR